MGKHTLRTLLAILLLCAIMPSFGQNPAPGQTKKVAILETIDKNNDYTYGAKLMLRSKLIVAVNSKKGLEALDRTVMSAITNEQAFQLSGMVSDDEIKAIGEMSGADYILASEVAKISEDVMFISARVVDVVTLEVKAAANEMCSSDAAQFEESCQKVVSKLFQTATNQYGQTLAATPEKGRLVLHLEARKDLIKEFTYTSPDSDKSETIKNIDISNVEVKVDGKTIGNSALKEGFHYSIPLSGKHEISIKVQSHIGPAITKIKIDTKKAAYYEFTPKFNSVLGRYKLEIHKRM